MAKICYTPKNFSAPSRVIISQANSIITNMRNQGYDLTLRQLYYQFVAAALIPNKDTEYKRLGSIINDARLAGLIDWDAIIDRTRYIRSIAHWDTPADVIDAAARSFRLDKWDTQPKRIEVWIEKDALVGVIERVCNQNDIPFFACRGYVSQSEVWAAAQRIRSYMEVFDQDVIVLHLGDHDPSGIDMSRDIEDRLKLFLLGDWLQEDPNGDAEQFLNEFFWDEWDEDEYGNRDRFDENDFDTWPIKAREAFTIWMRFNNTWADRLEVRRIALNANQVRQYNPPPNPAKLTDSRAADYIATHGRQSWELDALSPAVINQLVQDEIDIEIDLTEWNAIVTTEDEHRRKLKVAAGQWDTLAAGL